MSKPNIYVRVHNRKDTDSSWSKLNPVLLDGEVIIVSLRENIIRFKVGDGVTHYNNLPFLNDEIIKDIDNLRNQFDSKLDSRTSPDNVGKILSVDDEGKLIFTNIDTSGQNVTISSVIGLSELLEKKANTTRVDELASSLELIKEDLSSIDIESIESLEEVLSNKADDKDLKALEEKVDNLQLEMPTNISINNVEGLSDVLISKADDSEIEELNNSINYLGNEVDKIEKEMDNKLSAVLPVTEAGKVLCIDDNGNIVPKEIEFTGGGSGGSGGPLTWGDILGIKG